ncbi:MAG TPA: hypothetical protein EYQ83_16440 [Acidobacteria bacterium]|nr:hypothetical protein [Acidobacteriota bacterium]
MSTYAMSVRRSARGASRCATGVWLLLWLTSTSPGPAAAQPLQLVHLAEGRLTVAAHDASLRGLIEEISRESGVRLERADALRGDVTVRFRRRTLEDGLALILSGWRYALTSESGQGLGGSTEPSLFRLRVIGPRTVSFRAPAATAPPADQAAHQPIRESADGPGPFEALLASDDLTVVRRAGLAALRDPDRWVRARAVNALAARGGDDAVTLLEVALRDAEIGLRLDAIEALRRIGGDRAARGLTGVLHDRSRLHRLRAVDALGAIGGSTAMQLLDYVQAVDHDETVRAAAADQLAVLRARQ